MERKVNIQDWQKVTVEDFNNFGLFPRYSFDHIVGDVLIPSMAYTGFTTVQTAPAVITVGNGRLYHNGLVFYNDNEGGSSHRPVEPIASGDAALRRHRCVGPGN